MINKDDLKKYYARTRQLILNPKREWSLIDNEHDSPLQLFSNYLIPLAIMASIVVLLLGLLHYNGLHTLLYTLINFISITLGTYLTFIITREYLTGKLPDAEGTALHLSVYSAAVFTLFHSLAVALVMRFLESIIRVDQPDIFTHPTRRYFGDYQTGNRPKNQYADYHGLVYHMYSGHL